MPRKGTTQRIRIGKAAMRGNLLRLFVADVEQISSRGAPVADIILSHVASRGADMIVIGAYSHARSVEMVFGGATRTLLKKSTVPVLMSL